MADQDLQHRAKELDSELAHLDLVNCLVEAGGAKVKLRKPRSAEALICEEDFQGDERLPYWADVWPSARALAGEMRSLNGEGKTLLELGCGTGLVAVTALRAGFTVTATDYYPDALRVTRLNAMRLAGDGDQRLSTRLVDWRALPPDLGTFDVVCASDVLYEMEYAQLVASTIDKTLAAGGVVLVADPGRAPLNAFRKAIEGLGMEELEPLALRVPQDTQAGDLVSRSRPGGNGMTPDAPGMSPAHRVTIWRYRRPNQD